MANTNEAPSPGQRGNKPLVWGVALTLTAIVLGGGAYVASNAFSSGSTDLPQRTGGIRGAGAAANSLMPPNGQYNWYAEDDSVPELDLISLQIANGVGYGSFTQVSSYGDTNNHTVHLVLGGSTTGLAFSVDGGAVGIPAAFSNGYRTLTLTAPAETGGLQNSQYQAISMADWNAKSDAFGKQHEQSGDNPSS